MAEEKFLSDANIDGKIIVNVVPNNIGTIMTYNPTTKTLSTRTNAQIISDLGLATNSQLGQYVPLTGTNQFTGLLSDPNNNFRFGTDGVYKSVIRLEESGNPNFPNQTASFYYNIEEGFGVTLGTDNSFNQLNLQPGGLFVLTSDTVSGGSQIFHDGTGLYNSLSKQPLNSNYYIQAGYANDNFIKKTVLSARAIGDANDAQGTDFYYLGSSNKPTGSTDGVLQSFSYDSNLWYTQMYSDWRTNEWYVRVKSNGSWGNWQKLYHDGNFNPQVFVPQTRNITINGVTQDLSADRSWTVATYTAGAGLTLSGTQFSLPVIQGTGGNAVTSVTQTANGIQVDKANFVLLTALYNILANYVDKQNVNGVIPDEWQLVPNSLTAGSFIKFLGENYGYPMIGWRDSTMIFTDEGAIDLNQYGIRQNDADYYNTFNGNTQFQYVEFNLPQGNQPFHVASTTMIQNLNADMLDGYHASDFITSATLNNYALRTGANATDTWVGNSYGAIYNPPYLGKSFNSGGGVGLLDATYGTQCGFINTSGTASGNPNDNWFHRIKMLHQNSSGYYTEIAVQMTSGNSMWYRRYENGSNYGWIQVWDSSNFNPNNYIPTSHVAYGITTTNINQWNSAYSQAHSHSNKPLLDLINQDLQIATTPTFDGIQSSSPSNRFFIDDGATIGFSEDIDHDGSQLWITPYTQVISNPGSYTYNKRHKLVYITYTGTGGADITIDSYIKGQRIYIANLGGDEILHCNLGGDIALGRMRTLYYDGNRWIMVNTKDIDCMYV